MNNRQVIFGTPPSKSNSYRIINQWDPKRKKFHASLTKTDALKKYENDFYIQCNKYRDANIEGYFTLTIDAYYPNQRSDVDGVLKGVLDCLQKVKAFKNDNKCTKIILNKYLDKLNPRIEFDITPAME